MGNLSDDLSRRIMGTLRTDPNSSSIADQVHANVSVLTHRNCQRAELSDRQRYLEISRSLLTSSVMLHRGRPVGPDSAGLAFRLDAWKWLYHQARNTIGNSNRQHLSHIDELRGLSADFSEARRSVNFPCKSHPMWLENWPKCTKWRRIAGWHIEVGRSRCPRMQTLVRKHFATQSCVRSTVTTAGTDATEWLHWCRTFRR